MIEKKNIKQAYDMVKRLREYGVTGELTIHFPMAKKTDSLERETIIDPEISRLVDKIHSTARDIEVCDGLEDPRIKETVDSLTNYLKNLG
jgi:hypothetical protein